jgi:hypothetical protein
MSAPCFRLKGAAMSCALLIMTGCTGATDMCAALCAPPGVCKAGQCVQCIDDSSCSGRTPVCDLSTNTCSASDAGVSTCAAERVVNLNSDGVQDGLTLSYSGTLEGSVNQLEPPASCQLPGGSGPEVAHTFSLPVKADLTFTTATPGTEVDTVLYSVASCTPGMAPPGGVCSDDVDRAGGNLGSTVSFASSDAGTTTTLVVDTFSPDAVRADAGRYQLDVVVRPQAPVDGACDPEVRLNRCPDGETCSRLKSTCEAATPPVITSLAFMSSADGSRRIAVGGADPNGDTNGCELEFLDQAGNPMQMNGAGKYRASFSPPTLGQTTFSGAVSEVNRSLLAAASVRVALIDAVGLKSTVMTAPLTAAPAIAAGQACQTTGATGDCVRPTFCKVSTASALSGTCTAGTAPTLTSAAAYYGGAAFKPRVSFKATDPESDLDAVVVSYLLLDGGVALLTDGGTSEADEVTAYLGTSTLNGYANLDARLSAPWSLVSQLQVTLKDRTGLTSTTMTTPFEAQPIAPQGLQCDVTGVTVRCADATNVCGSNQKCMSRADAVAAACGAPTPITLGTPVTTTLPAGPDLFKACAGETGGPEKIFSFTTTATSDVLFTTDFPETTVDTVVYTSSNCAQPLAINACNDDRNFELGQLGSRGIARDLPAGTYFLIVDSWASSAQLGTGRVKLQVSTVPVITTAGTACDPLRELNRCGADLKCKPDPTYTAYTCR